MVRKSSVSVADYSVRGKWVQIVYPGGRITLPKRELSAVDEFYRDEVFYLASAVCQEHTKRWEDAWQFRLVGEDSRAHLVEFLVEIDLVTRPRSLPQKIQQAQFKLVVACWVEGGQTRVMEWDRTLVWSGEFNSSGEGPITESDIPKSIVERMLHEAPKLASFIEGVVGEVLIM